MAVIKNRLEKKYRCRKKQRNKKTKHGVALFRTVYLTMQISPHTITNARIPFIAFEEPYRFLMGISNTAARVPKYPVNICIRRDTGTQGTQKMKKKRKKK